MCTLNLILVFPNFDFNLFRVYGNFFRLLRQFKFCRTNSVAFCAHFVWLSVSIFMCVDQFIYFFLSKYKNEGNRDKNNNYSTETHTHARIVQLWCISNSFAVLMVVISFRPFAKRVHSTNAKKNNNSSSSSRVNSYNNNLAPCESVWLFLKNKQYQFGVRKHKKRLHIFFGACVVEMACC